jgi:hypothetical protein
MAHDYSIQFPGGITLVVHLQNPHPVDMTVKFSDGGGVHFTYPADHDNKGKVEFIEPVICEPGSGFDHRVRPGSLGTSNATGSPASDVAIQYNDPEGSHM